MHCGLCGVGVECPGHPLLEALLRPRRYQVTADTFRTVRLVPGFTRVEFPRWIQVVDLHSDGGGGGILVYRWVHQLQQREESKA